MKLVVDMCAPAPGRSASAAAPSAPVVRYSRDASFQILCADTRFVLVMAAGSIAGTIVGGLLLGVVPSAALMQRRST
ncbi:hypothetical protein K8O92_27745 [Nocardia asteroides]|nr:hypothetical protein K8O92_27745 [Nocardia asteroides]